VEFKCSDAHKRAMNFIYQRPLYPEVWDEEEVRRGAVKVQSSGDPGSDRTSGFDSRPRRQKPKLVRRQSTLF